MEYILKEKRVEKATLNWNEKALTMDVTLIMEITDGEITLPFSEGITITVKVPDGFAEEITSKIEQHLTTKYKTK